MNRKKHQLIQEVCRAVENSDIMAAKQIVKSDYPFEPVKPVDSGSRKYNETVKTKVFLRDGFTDRYSGESLVFPPVLRLLSNLMPDEIPYHPHWKMSECHYTFWELYPTIDHVVPVARGGVNEDSNWVCTSQLKNSIKSNWTLDELGWELHPSGDLNDWDGLINWFLKYTETNPELFEDQYLRSWHKAATVALQSLGDEAE